MDNSSHNLDQRLLQAYRETVYQVLNPDIAIEIGVANSTLNHFLQQMNARTWAFITAWNPRSQLLTLEENKQRHQAFVEMVEKAGYLYFEGKGVGTNTNWEPEKSVLILNISKENALRIAGYFDQNALVFGVIHKPPQMLLC